jgi:hypothetical protein
MYTKSYINTEFLDKLDCIDQASFSKPENFAKTPLPFVLRIIYDRVCWIPCGRLVGRSVGWSVGQSVGRSFGRSIGWKVDWSGGWLFSLLVCYLEIQNRKITQKHLYVR